jgi:hypothetical protein
VCKTLGNAKRRRCGAVVCGACCCASHTEPSAYEVNL